MKLPFGLKNGQIVEINEVEKGLACNCICPSCGSPLIARKGQKKIHHFAHYKADCKAALETAIHLAAKKILLEEKRILVPPMVLKTYHSEKVIRKEGFIYFNEIKTEKKINNLRPDLIARYGKNELIIEIAVTHFVDEEKIQQIKNSGITALEIDLSKLKRINFNDLRKILIKNINLKTWIYSKEIETAHNIHKNKSKKLRIINRRLMRHVDWCPINARNYYGKPYANYIDDCLCCKYLFDVEFNDENQDYIYCLAK